MDSSQHGQVTQTILIIKCESLLKTFFYHILKSVLPNMMLCFLPNMECAIKAPTITVDGKGSLSNNFSVIFPSFVHLLATLWLSSLGHQASYQEVTGLSTGQNFDFFFFKFSKFLKFSDSFIFFNFPKIFGNEIFIPINLIIFKAPPVQF